MLRKLVHARGYPVFVNADAVRFVAPHKGGQHAFVIFDQAQKILVQGGVEEVAHYLYVGGFAPPAAKPGVLVELDEA